MLLLLPALLFSAISFSEPKIKGFYCVKRSRCLCPISTKYYVKKRSLINEFFLEMFLKEKTQEIYATISLLKLQVCIFFLRCFISPWPLQKTASIK